MVYENLDNFNYYLGRCFAVGVSAGFGFPLYLFQKHTMLSITGQYVRVSPSISRMLSEDRFVIKLGLTFNERWVMKWRVQ